MKNKFFRGEYKFLVLNQFYVYVRVDFLLTEKKGGCIP